MQVVAENAVDMFGRAFHRAEAQPDIAIEPSETRMLFHDLRKLVQGVVAPADTLEMALEQGDTDLAKTTLIRLKNNANRVVEMLGCGLAAARKKDAQNVECDVAKVLDDVVNSLAPLLERKGVVVRRWVVAPATASMSEKDLYRALLNLLANAVDATDGNGEPITVVVEPVDDRWAQITVRDKGNGIPKGALAHVFEEGYTTKAHQGGTGLGLAIVKRVAEAYHGNVGVSSRPGAGAKFTLRLPIGQRGNRGSSDKVFRSN
jgi:signal transduction histidine kinase